MWVDLGEGVSLETTCFQIGQHPAQGVLAQLLTFPGSPEHIHQGDQRKE